MTSLTDLAKFKLGAQTGTTSLTAVHDVIKPEQDPLVFQNTNNAKQAMLNGQVDAIVADLPTRVLHQRRGDRGQRAPRAVPVRRRRHRGVRPALRAGQQAAALVNGALAALKKDGTLADLETTWLSDVVSVPELQ